MSGSGARRSGFRFCLARGFAAVILVGLLAACSPVALPPSPQASIATPKQTPRPASTGALQTAQAEAFSEGAPVRAAPTPTLAATPEPAGKQEVQPAPATATSGTAGSGAVEQVSFRDEIFLAGSPAFAMVFECKMPDQLTPGEPAVTWTAGLDSGMLCLFGFAENEIVHYMVRDAAGELVVEDEGVPDNLDGDPLSSVKVMLGIVEDPPGVWTVEAAGASGKVSARFDVQPVTLEGERPIILLLHGATALVPIGAQLPIAAYGLPAGDSFALGVYQVVSGDARGRNLRLHEGATLHADPAGMASATLTLDPSYSAGDYCIVLAADPGYEFSQALSPVGATRCFEVTEK